LGQEKKELFLFLPVLVHQNCLQRGFPKRGGNKRSTRVFFFFFWGGGGGGFSSISQKGFLGKKKTRIKGGGGKGGENKRGGGGKVVRGLKRFGAFSVFKGVDGGTKLNHFLFPGIVPKKKGHLLGL